LSKVFNVALLDDHRIFLEGISLLLADQYNVMGFSAPTDLLQKIQGGTSFDLVLCDLIMPEMNGLAFISAVRAHTHQTPILVLSGINTLPPIAEIMRLGADGFVHKSANNETLLDALKTVLTGGQYFVNEYGEDIVDPSPISKYAVTNDHLDSACLPALGVRQFEVLQMIAQGASNKEIANRLKISENTVKTHLKQIFAELRVNKRTACVRKAQTLGLI